MAGQEKKRNPRNAALILDLLHIVIGILVVICAILAFLPLKADTARKQTQSRV